MTVLSDYSIYSLVRSHNLITPFLPERLNASSYDLGLGPNVMLENTDGNMYHSTLRDRELVVEPGEFFLAESEEIFHLPDNVCAFVKLKSSRAREGWNHLMAGWCDPGWNNSVLTLELTNSRRYKNLTATEGLLMVQMVFVYTDQPVGVPYRGQYNNDRTVSPSKVS